MLANLASERVLIEDTQTSLASEWKDGGHRALYHASRQEAFIEVLGGVAAGR